MLSVRGLCDELITRPDEFYLLWCVVVGYLETSRMRKQWPALGRSDTGKENTLSTIDIVAFAYFFTCVLLD